MRRKMGWLALLVAAGTAAVWAAFRFGAPAPISAAHLAQAYATPLPAVAEPIAVYHLGHSLVGPDMPAMLAQLAGPGHRFNSQLGWGASLMNHRTGEVPGFAEMNHPPAFRDAATALASGDYEAVVLTEMVEIRDAIRWHDSAANLAHWARAARAGRGDVRIYLYETWHRLDDPEGWLNRIDRDLARYWEEALLRHAMAAEGVGTIHLIPGGQVMAAAVRAIDAGRVPGLTRREDLFALAADGSVDPIHLNDIGAYLMALTHYAVLYGKTPVGLPEVLQRADGSPARALSVAGAQALQEVVWRVVTGYAATGVSG